MRPTWFSKSSVSLMIRAFLRQPQRRSLERARQTLGRSLQGVIECPSSQGTQRPYSALVGKDSNSVSVGTDAR